jgi:hypothetical protein
MTAKRAATLPSASSGRYVVIGNPEGRRVALFLEALGRVRPGIACVVVSWVDLLCGKVHLSEVVRAGDVVRIDSPGKNFEVEKLLLERGVERSAMEGSDTLPAAGVRGLRFEKGRILHPRQWFLGFRDLLFEIGRTLPPSSSLGYLAHPAQIIRMSDKPAARSVLSEGGVNVPSGMDVVGSFEELTEAMTWSNVHRVFVKLAHGSSASGIVAYQTDGRRHLAHTTVERGMASALYNTRRVRTLTDRKEIAALVDALVPHGIYAERWLPKAGLDGRALDLRVLVIGGKAMHTVVRQSRTPMTNLHLLNARGDLEKLRARMGESAWAESRRVCERSAACFPQSLHVGVDLLVSPSLRKFAVAEVNAFGDLLPGVKWEGRDTYETEILAMEEKCSTPAH